MQCEFLSIPKAKSESARWRKAANIYHIYFFVLIDPLSLYLTTLLDYFREGWSKLEIAPETSGRQHLALFKPLRLGPWSDPFVIRNVSPGAGRMKSCSLLRTLKFVPAPGAELKRRQTNSNTRKFRSVRRFLWTSESCWMLLAWKTLGSKQARCWACFNCSYRKVYKSQSNGQNKCPSSTWQPSSKLQMVTTPQSEGTVAKAIVRPFSLKKKTSWLVRSPPNSTRQDVHDRSHSYAVQGTLGV